MTADKVYISDNLHSYEDILKSIIKQPIKQINIVLIGDGSWLGENVCIIGANVGKNCVIGAGGLLYINWILLIADFSFYIGKNDYYIDDAGYAKDSAKLLIDYGFSQLNLHKIWMELYEYDEKKLRFFQDSMGFTIDGKLRDNCFQDGRYYDSYILSKVKKR